MGIRDLSGLLSAVLHLGRWFCHSGPTLHPTPPPRPLAGALSSPDPLTNRRCFETSWPPNSLVSEEPEAVGGTCSAKKKGLSAQQSQHPRSPSQHVVPKGLCIQSSSEAETPVCAKQVAEHGDT